MSPLNVKETEMESPVLRDEKEKICNFFILKSKIYFFLFFMK